MTNIPHEGGELTFQYLAFRGHYGNVIELTEKDNLKIRPTSPKMASLIHNAFKNIKGKIKEINFLEDFWLLESTGNLYLPKSKEEISSGVILQDDPLIVNEKLVMSKSDLIKLLENAEEFRIDGHPIFISENRFVRFVPFGYRTGEQTWQKLEKNPYIAGRYLGRKNNELEHSTQIAEIASKYEQNPLLNSFNSVDKKEIRMSALGGGGWSFGRFVIDGDWDYNTAAILNILSKVASSGREDKGFVLAGLISE